MKLTQISYSTDILGNSLEAQGVQTKYTNFLYTIENTQQIKNKKEEGDYIIKEADFFMLII
jgi:hypothetical protein